MIEIFSKILCIFALLESAFYKAKRFFAKMLKHKMKLYRKMRNRFILDESGFSETRNDNS